ncbi:peptidoglycan-associated lipoprotein Pal [Candidatus Sumerlaeota bacterium]|nr:peptidoglycan-associated lipoprotein Pal [Candidatus Sumerlaeota bacterium]
MKNKWFNRLMLLALMLSVVMGGSGCAKIRNSRLGKFFGLKPARNTPRVAVIPDDQPLPVDDPLFADSEMLPIWDIEDSASGDVAYDTLGIPENEPMRIAPEGILVDLNMINFAYNSSELPQRAREILDQHAEWLKQYPNIVIQIEGHCDERGTFEYNLNLGQRRADSVKEYLVSRGIGKDRLYTISYGEERPLVTASTNEAYQQNRRVQFLAYGAE